MIRIDLAPEQLQAAVNVIGERVSATGEERTPLEQAEREMDGALMQYEQEMREAAPFT